MIFSFYTEYRKLLNSREASCATAFCYLNCDYIVKFTRSYFEVTLFFWGLCSGGWAILQVPPTLSLVGDTLVVTCRVRGTSQLREVILYKEGIEVMRQKGLNPHFTLTNVTVADQGMYSCRASWDIERRTRSVISVDTLLQVVGELMCCDWLWLQITC